MTFEDNGDITAKSDFGGYTYDDHELDVNSSPETYASDQTITYTTFEKVNTISEGDYSAEFLYNADFDRAKMVVKNNGTTFLSRWYAGSRYIKETLNSVTKEYTYIGGDAYSAPCVIVKYGGNNTPYFLLRDHLGSITHVADNSGNIVYEYSFDAWGRQRSPTNWTTYSVDNEPSLFMGRGYTGHEHLPWFNLINMNGRLYDPLVGRMLSPDPNVQMPDYTQNYNRYSYALNNPLVNADPDGEFIFTLLAAIIPGAQFLLPAAMQLDMGWMVGGINAAHNGGNFWEGAWKGGTSSIINAGLAMLNVPGMLPNGFLHAGTNIVGSGISNSIMGRPFFENWGMSAGEGFAGGAWSGYEMAKELHANIWTGSLDPSLKYIVQSEYGNSIYSEYGIGNHGSEYHVARNSNLPDGFSTSKGFIKTKDGDLLWGLAYPGNSYEGRQILGSDVYISRNTIKNYFLGDQVFSLEKVKHEFFHLKDYFSGNYLTQNSLYKSQGLVGNDLYKAMGNWLEFRAYFNNYINWPKDYFLAKMKLHFNMPWDMFWNVYGY